MKRISWLIRWIARILGTLMALFAVVMGVGEGLPRPSELTPNEQMMWAGLIVMMIGVLAAWKWEVAGAFLILAGFVVKWVAAGQYPATLFGLFPLAGFLYLIAWMLEHEPVAATAANPKEQKTKKAKGKGKRKRGAKA
jgi:hypothetical protein